MNWIHYCLMYLLGAFSQNHCDRGSEEHSLGTFILSPQSVVTTTSPLCFGSVQQI
jgi:hypothetical protein